MGSAGSRVSLGSVLVLVLVLVLAPVAASAQVGSLANANIVAVSGDIQAQVGAAAREAAPSWVAWRVPAHDGRSRSCCWYSNGPDRWCGCSLEPGSDGRPASARPDDPIPLEGSTHVIVLARVADGRVERVRSFSGDCPLDAGGRTVRFIDGVSADASVRWLADLVTSGATADAADDVDRDERRVSHAALAAIAATAGQAAGAALDGFAAPSHPPALRRRAIFWIGQSRGDAGFRTLRTLLQREDDSRTRRAIVQAMSRSKSADATPALLAIAKNDADAATRGEALFWLAQRAGESVAADISEAAKNDPDARVQERAVMALSQLPKDQGVPLLIDIARSHSKPQVRKRAMFWLGQSKDPRAIRFFEEVLIGR